LLDSWPDLKDQKGRRDGQDRIAILLAGHVFQFVGGAIKLLAIAAHLSDMLSDLFTADLGGWLSAFWSDDCHSGFRFNRSTNSLPSAIRYA